MAEPADVVLIGLPKRLIVDALKDRFVLHVLPRGESKPTLSDGVAGRVRAAVVTGAPDRMEGALMAQFPALEIVSSFGVGYDNIDLGYAVPHGIVVCHTPDVLTEEVADTALGLLLCTVREFSQAERYLRAGRWRAEGNYRLSRATLRNRTVGIVGLGRIGLATARRLDGFGVPTVYHNRNPRSDVPYRYFPSVIDMARAVDTLMLITPGGPGTRHLVNAEVLDALGPEGIVINMARGSVIDDGALIAALRDGRTMAAGLDVFVNEPEVPAEYLEMDNVVLFPHLGSASVHTRQNMEQLVVDNVLAWADGRRPLTPVPETPYAPKARTA